MSNANLNQPPESGEIELKSIKHTNGRDNNAYAPDGSEDAQKTSPSDGVPMKDTEIDDSDEDTNACSRAVGRAQQNVYSLISANKRLLKYIFLLVLLKAYFAYFAYAMYYEFGDEGSIRLLVCTVIVSLCLVGYLIYSFLKDEETDEDHQSKIITVVLEVGAKLRLGIVLPILLIIAFTAFLIADIAIRNPRSLVSLSGMAFFLISFFLFSYNPSRVKWRPVFWGLAIQVIFAILILRTDWGRDAFDYAGDRVREFLAYSDAGAKFLFDAKNYLQHPFAFQVLPVVVFFSTFVSMMYYLGVMQLVIRLVGRFLAFCLGTSPTESINAAGNIFIGQTEAPLMIRPFLADMTNSEIHAVMTGGFATIAGSVMAAYIAFGVPANHILSASVMSAPAALAMAKLFYPETEKTRHKAKDVYNLARGEERNIIEAASNGASMSVKLVANIAVNLIAFVALLEFVNATLTWFGDRVGIEKLTFQFICSYVFWPLAYIMGIDPDDCKVVGELIGTKTFLNEFIAYMALSEYIGNREIFDEYISNMTSLNASFSTSDLYTKTGDSIHLTQIDKKLTTGLISQRSVVISTYALCGFSNFASMGVQVGALGAMAPNRKGDLSRLVFRAMIAGNVACFLTACIAGLFYEE